MDPVQWVLVIGMCLVGGYFLLCAPVALLLDALAARARKKTAKRLKKQPKPRALSPIEDLVQWKARRGEEERQQWANTWTQALTDGDLPHVDWWAVADEIDGMERVKVPVRTMQLPAESSFEELIVKDASGQTIIRIPARRTHP